MISERAICAKCRVPFKIHKNGVWLECHAKIGPYFKVAADRWYCPSCGAFIYVGFSEPTYHHEKRFSELPTQEYIALESGTEIPEPNEAMI